MNRELIQKLLEQVRSSEVGIEAALEKLALLPFIKQEGLCWDTHRSLRTRMGEVIYCAGKTAEQLEAIVDRMMSHQVNILGTRVVPEMAQALQAKYPALMHDPISRTFRIQVRSVPPVQARLAIVAAGTSDMPVAEEAWVTARFFGLEAERYYDVGVAGLHRLLDVLPEIRKADAVIAVAGMEGALPSVLGGLIASPIVAVPTSVGYGTNFSGLTPLMAMLNSCAEGISVVNIDNGFGAACSALRILHKLS